VNGQTLLARAASAGAIEATQGNIEVVANARVGSIHSQTGLQPAAGILA
jgi:hypothetical protein